MRSHLEYAYIIWNAYRITQINDLENIQKRATKMVKGQRKITYKDRLSYLKLPTLKFRRIRGDMIEAFKLITGRYDPDVSPVLARNSHTSTRGNSHKLQFSRSKYDVRKYFFTSRIVKILCRIVSLKLN